MRNDDKEKKKEKGLISFERKKCPLFCDDFEQTSGYENLVKAKQL